MWVWHLNLSSISRVNIGFVSYLNVLGTRKKRVQISNGKPSVFELLKFYYTMWTGLKGSKYPNLEQIFMALQMFEPLSRLYVATSQWLN